MASDGVETGLFLGKIPFIKGGSGPRKAVVFFGGNALLKHLDRSDARRYAGMIAALLPTDTTFHILGYEEDPPPSYSLDAIVDDLAKIVGDEIGRATIIGISFGGFVALRFAATHPELVDRLVMLVSAHRFSPEGRQRIDAQIASLEAGDLEGMVRDNLALFRRPWYNGLVRLRLRRRKGGIRRGVQRPGLGRPGPLLDRLRAERRVRRQDRRRDADHREKRGSVLRPRRPRGDRAVDSPGTARGVRG